MNTPSYDLQACRERIPVLADRISLANCSHAPLTRPAREAVPVALLEDRVLRTWELVFDLAVSGEARRTAEYDEVVWSDPASLPEPLTPIARGMANLDLRRSATAR